MGACTWLDLLRRAVDESGEQAVAEKLEIPHLAVSLLLAGKYPARIARVAKRVLEKFGRCSCPFLEREISVSECRGYHLREAPTSSPYAMRHWRACRGCKHNQSVLAPFLSPD